MSEILSLAPQNVWKHFHSITQIPHPSGHLEKIQSFLLEFGKSVGVETFKDEAGNIIYRKPATPGMENRKTVIIQAHMDMVPQKIKKQNTISKKTLSAHTSTANGLNGQRYYFRLGQRYGSCCNHGYHGG